MMRLHCLHGFLGSPRDFDPIAQGLRERGIPVEIDAPNLFEMASLSMPECVDRLGKQSHEGEILLGYSMGGRLAMQVFGKEQNRAKALVVVSASAGGLNAERGRERMADDETWAVKFEEQDWGSLLEEWNGRAAFGGIDARVSRQEKDYVRKALALALVNWSVGRQPDMLPILAKDDRPMMWVAGELDTNYVARAWEAKEKVASLELRIIEGAGHRVPWENPGKFLDELATFLVSIRQ